MGMEEQQPAISSKDFCMTEICNQKDMRPDHVTPWGGWVRKRNIEIKSAIVTISFEDNSAVVLGGFFL